MIKDLKEFRQNLSDWCVCKNENDGKLYIGKVSGMTSLGRVADELYKECDMEDLPIKFQESIKEHLKFGGGMGAGLTWDKFFFSNTGGPTLHKCFVKEDRATPDFKMKLTDFSYYNVRTYIKKNHLPIRCRIHCNDNNMNTNKVLTGALFVDLLEQKYYNAYNLTGMEEMDEYFFWRGTKRKTLRLGFTYRLEKGINSNDIDDNEKKQIKEDIIRLFNQEKKKDIFADKWELA